MVVLIRSRLVVIPPLPICGGCLFRRRFDHLFRAIQADIECMGLNDQLSFAYDGEVARYLLLALNICLVFIAAVGDLLRRVEMGVEKAEVGATHPYRARSLERCAQHAAVLYILVLAGREVERLRL